MMLLAYHGREADKLSILSTLATHRLAGEIVKEKYWEGGKGGAVGCTVKSDDPAQYETQFGIPQMLGYLEESIFQGMPDDLAEHLPEQFMSAIRPGADLSRVGWQFLHWLLTDASVNPGIGHPLVRDAVRVSADTMQRLANGESVTWTEARSAWSAGRAAEKALWNAPPNATDVMADGVSSAASAVKSAWSAALAAAESARSADGAAGRKAMDSAGECGASAAYNAQSVARRADAVYAESLVVETEISARGARAAYILMSKKLLELLESA